MCDNENNVDITEINRINADKRKGDKSLPNPHRKQIKNKAPIKRRMTRAEYTKRYYEKHKETILEKQKERHKNTYVPKQEGWVKPVDDEERKARIRESKNNDSKKQYEKNKLLRMKNEDELTDSERILLQKIRERGRRYYHRKKINNINNINNI